MQFTGHYDLISESPLNSRQMSTPLGPTIFFFFVKNYFSIYLCVGSLKILQLAFIQRMKNTQMAPSSIKKSQATQKWSLTWLLPFISFKNYDVKDFLTKAFNPFSL